MEKSIKAPLVIGLLGKAKSGKDTAAHAIVECCNWFRCDAHMMAFAEPIRQIGEIFGFPEDTLRDQMLKESYQHPVLGITPRKFMQLVGTELFRNNLDPDVWVKLVEQKIIEFEGEADAYEKKSGIANVGPRCPKDVIIITDVRFKNEAAMIKKHGGLLFRIERTWGGNDAGDDAWRNHQSETEQEEITVDKVWYNNESTAIGWHGAAITLFANEMRDNNILIQETEKID